MLPSTANKSTILQNTFQYSYKQSNEEPISMQIIILKSVSNLNVFLI